MSKNLINYLNSLNSSIEDFELPANHKTIFQISSKMIFLFFLVLLDQNSSPFNAQTFNPQNNVVDCYTTKFHFILWFGTFIVSFYNKKKKKTNNTGKFRNSIFMLRLRTLCLVYLVCGVFK